MSGFTMVASQSTSQSHSEQIKEPCKWLKEVVGTQGLEPRTSCV